MELGRRTMVMLTMRIKTTTTSQLLLSQFQLNFEGIFLRSTTITLTTPPPPPTTTTTTTTKIAITKTRTTKTYYFAKICQN